MKPKTAGRGAANLRFTALLFLAAVYFSTVSTAVFAGGSNEQSPVRPELRLMLRSEPAVQPEWVISVRQSETEIFFVSESQPFSTEADARDSARERARIQVLDYYGQVIENQAVARLALSGSTSDILAPYINREEEIRSYAQNVVSEVATLEYYTEVWLSSDNKEEYIVYTLHSINRQKAEDEIANLADNISGRYTAAIPQWNTLRTAVEGYALIVKSLEQNPLHRIMAYYRTSSGRAGLYEYARFQLSELANSVSIEPIPTRSVQETETLYTTIRLRSSVIPLTGFLDCRAVLYGADLSGVSFPFITSNDDAFVLENKNLSPGSYNIMLEILLSELSGGIVNNFNGSFSFNVTALNPALTASGMEAGIKQAVDALAAELPAPTETLIGAFIYMGTNTPSPLSHYLYEKVKHYAVNNRERKYRIVSGEEEHDAVISGFFIQRNDRVDVTLELTTTTGGLIGSQIFTLSAAELERERIAVAPENMRELEQRRRILSGVSENTQINIQARFNSQSLTYRHRDELKITVQADRDCYFKVYHIDVDNRIRMVYPTRNSPDNYLSANTQRAINTGSMFYEPYGAETILLVSSAQQFSGIEQEYNQPWRPATEEYINRSLPSAKAYSIVVIKPDEILEFKRPENMMETYEAIRDDVIRQGGYFEGSAATGLSAFYTIGTVRGSFIIPGDRPDIIQFAAYNLDNYSGASFGGDRTRGAGFSFQFERPEDIMRALQAVRSGIEGKGGTFTGNEQQGSFRADGIAGQYRVNDRVSVTITEKPFIIPNSLIEREVKNFFNVR